MKRKRKAIPTPRPARREPEHAEASEWLDCLDPERARATRMVCVGLITITRDTANEMLVRVDANFQRNMSAMVAIRYGADMNAGDWVEGVPMLVFDRNGRLLNGQHVLNAFLLSNLKSLLVTWQINRHPNAYMAFDHNRKRSASDTLRWNGVEKPGETASTAVSLFQYEQGFFKGKDWTAGVRTGDKFPTDAQIQAIVKAHPGLDKHLWKSPFKGKGLSVGALRAASYVLHCIDPEVAAKFYESLIQGINIPSNRHPLWALRKTFMDMEPSQRMRNGETFARIFKAWNSYISAGRISPQLKKGETFPDPLDPGDFTAKSPRPDGPLM